MAKPDPVVHFEMPAEDQKRMVDFYEKSFGWKAQMLGPQMGDYTLVKTAETDERNFPKEVGRINGGFWKKDKSRPAQHPNIVIAVDDIAVSMDKVKNSGGKLIGEPVYIPGTGKYISFFDTEGNRVAMIQPDPM